MQPKHREISKKLLYFSIALGFNFFIIIINISIIHKPLYSNRANKDWKRE